VKLPKDAKTGQCAGDYPMPPCQPRNQWPAGLAHTWWDYVAQKQQMTDFGNGKAELLETYIAQMQMDCLNENPPAGNC